MGSRRDAYIEAHSLEFDLENSDCKDLNYDDCEKIIELCWWHLATCELADCIIDSCDIMREGLE